MGNILLCEVRPPQTVRLVIRRDKDKVYEFETHSPEEAEEIVTRINVELDKYVRKT